MKKAIKLFCVILPLLFLFSLPAYALESDAESDVSHVGEEITEAPDGELPSTESTDTPATEEDVPPLTAVYSVLMEHSAEILSALTLVGSVIIAFTYKKGLLPILSAALTRISGGVSGISESVSAITDSQTEERGEMREAMSGVMGTLKELHAVTDTLASGIGSLEKRLAALEGDGRDKERLTAVMTAEVDMLYEIFMQSSLPQYSKDAVSEKIKAMRESLAACGVADSDG